jgi:hypothetical protein
MISRNPKERPKSVGVDMPASGSVKPPGVGDACAICPEVGVGVEVDVAPGGVVGVGLVPPIGVLVGVTVGVSADVAVGVKALVTVGVSGLVGVRVGSSSVKLKANAVQAIGDEVTLPEFWQSSVPTTFQEKDPAGTLTVPNVAFCPVGSVGTLKVSTN